MLRQSQLSHFLNSSTVLASYRCKAAVPRSRSARLAPCIGRTAIFTTASPRANLHEPAVIDFDMPPDYESQSFWDTRFKRENHFEWLGDGQETIIPVLRPLLQTAVSAQPFRTPRLLHIGAGTSSLSDHVLALYHEVVGGQVKDVIVNTDFAGQAVEKGQKAERERGREGIRWEQADLLSWQDVVRLKESMVFAGETSQATFDFVADKSTSDAISCGDNMTFTQGKLTNPSTPLHPIIRAYLSQHPGEVLQMEPLEVLALHLASLVRPNGIWIALSYSNDRFPFLVHPSHSSRARTGFDMRSYWKVDKVQTVSAPSGWGKSSEDTTNVHTPEIRHHLYTFRRSDIPLA